MRVTVEEVQSWRSWALELDHLRLADFLFGALQEMLGTVLPCPDPGCPGRGAVTDDPMAMHRFRVECDSCGLVAPGAHSYGQAVENWKRISVARRRD